MYPRNHLTMLLHHLRNVKRDLSLSEFGRLCRQRHLDERLRMLARLCTSRLEFVIAQRYRQTIQILHLYQKIWQTRDLKELVRTWNYRRYLFNRGQFVFASTLVTSYNWDKERISDREMYSYCSDINEVYKLKDATVVCPECRLRIVIDVVRPDVTYCKCKDIHHNFSCEPQDWEPFIERQDMIVWRRVEEDTGGLYAYKVYGSFDDVTAEDFLQVQIDIDYRKEWDHTAKELTVLETDPNNSNDQNGTCDILYWEMIWPALFANRDYVYQRRWMQDEEKGIIVIISKVTDHPDAPVRSNTHRVSSYWSYMVIKPYREFNEKGIEFTLTYFDDPGVSLSYAITSWVAMRGFPDYLCRMREASKQYKSYKMSKEDNTIASKSEDRRDRDSQDELEQPNIIKKNADVLINNTTQHKPDENIKMEKQSEVKSRTDENSEPEKTESPETVGEETSGFLSSFFITRLFA